MIKFSLCENTLVAILVYTFGLHQMKYQTRYNYFRIQNRSMIEILKGKTQNN